MKKAYIEPKMEEIKVALSQHLLNNSIEVTNNQATVTNGYYNSDSRSAGDWFDDDDDY